MSTFRTTALLGALLASSALVQAAPGLGSNPALEPGDATRAWLHEQRNNTQAAPNKGMLGSASALAYQRYLDSYKYRIPDHYFTNSDLFKPGGGSK